MKRKILIEPDPILRKKCEPLEKVDLNVRKLMKDMLETMYDAPGIGFAAVQIGILKRLIVIDISKDDKKRNPLFLINLWEHCIFLKFLSNLNLLEFQYRL